MGINLGSLAADKIYLGSTEVDKIYIGSTLAYQKIQHVTDGLVLYLDTAKASSYPGSGTTWYDISGNDNDFTMSSAFISGGLYPLLTANNVYNATNLTTSSNCTLVFWMKTADEQALYWNIPPNGSYIGAYRVGNKEYYAIGGPDFYIDTVDRPNIYDYVRDSQWHMIEFKKVNLSAWASNAFNKYSSYEFNDGHAARIMVYNRNLTAAESLQNLQNGPSVLPMSAIRPTRGTLTSVSSSAYNTRTLTWTAAGDPVGISNYKIYRSTLGSDSGYTLRSTVGNVLTTNDTVTNFDDIYYYYVVAVNTVSNESMATEHVSGAAWPATNTFPTGSVISDNTGEVNSVAIFTSARFATVVSDSTDKHDGTYSAKFSSVGTDLQQYRDIDIFTVTSGKRYVFRYWAKANTTTKSKFSTQSSVAQKFEVPITSTSWTEYERVWVADFTGTLYLNFYTAYNTVDGTEIAWFDNMRIYEMN